MSGVPDHMLQHDLNSFPREDPKIAAARMAAQAKEEKARKADEAQQRRKEKEEAAAVRKVMAQPVQSKKAPAKKPEIDTDRQRALDILKINLYYKEFASKISVEQPKVMPKAAEAVKELRLAVEADLHSQGGIAQATNMYMTGIALAEQASAMYPSFGINLAGPRINLSSAMLQNKAQMEELVKEFAICHADWLMVGPGKRLLGFTMQMALMTNQANSAPAPTPRTQDDLQKEAEEL
jgi:hypothetical protein